MYCNFEACLECCKTYILEQPIPQCMNIKTICSREWTRKFLFNNFPQSFLTNKYKVHRENVLLEQERALFVETQPYVINQIELEKSYEEITKISKEISKLNKHYDSLLIKHRELSNKKTHEKEQYVRSCPKNECNGFLNHHWKCGICETKYCKDCHQPLNERIKTEHNNPVEKTKETEPTEPTEPSEPTEPTEPIEPTEPSEPNEPSEEAKESIYINSNSFFPNQENNTNNEIWFTLSNNHTELTQTIHQSALHVCNENDLATAKLLEKDTKPCPKCNMGIFKIDGCNQMFCTKCNTAFDWLTRKIMNVNIHNPHYFEWIRRQENDNIITQPIVNPNDCPVFTEITNETTRSIVFLVRSKKNINDGKKDKLINNILSVCRHIHHLRQVIMPVYRYDYVERNRKLRILLIRNKISESNFKIQIQKNDKKYAKSQEIYNVLELLTNGTSDIILRFMESLRLSVQEFTNETEAIIKEIEPIVKYVNECFDEISLTYKSKKLRVNEFLAYR